MQGTAIRAVLLALILSSSALYAEEDPSKKLEAIEAQLKQSSDDPMLHYRKAQALMALGKREDGYKTAKDAMQFFIKKNNDLAWMMLENIPLEPLRADVHFNLGNAERNPPKAPCGLCHSESGRRTAIS